MEALKTLKQLRDNSIAYLPELVGNASKKGAKVQFIVQVKVVLLNVQLKDTTIDTLKKILTNNKYVNNAYQTEHRLAAIEVLKDRSVKG